jgi:membrane-bound serine protease (ClpP class)
MILIISLILAALILFTAEIFLPGLIAGVLGALCLIGSVVVASYEYGANTGFILFVAELVGCAVLFMCWMRFFPASPLGRKFSLNQQVPQTSAPVELNNLLGKHGVTLTPLRPSGSAKIDGQRHDVISEGIHLPANSNITVVKVEGARILVRQF